MSMHASIHIDALYNKFDTTVGRRGIGYVRRAKESSHAQYNGMHDEIPLRRQENILHISV
jgi:hypothetical protein